MQDFNEVTQTTQQPFRDVYTVSRLTRETRALLENAFPLIWIEGEISNFASPASGHWYFSLKDDQAQIRCAMFRNRNIHTGVVPQNGMQVLLRARISMYEARGEFQIIAEHIETAGDGALRREFELLKQRLHAEGLFDQRHKKPLPASIQTIGVITSPSGAALRDILTTLQRRYPAAQVIIYPVTVQGADSAPQIVSMLQTATERNECDVLILARGGGSLEDLWSFNDERVARAIYACALPVVVGVGHEVDFTIADMVADVRAATPTAAAEIVSPNQHELHTRVQQLINRYRLAIQSKLRHTQQQLNVLQGKLTHPGYKIQQKMQRIDDYQQRLSLQITHQLRHNRAALLNLSNKLQAMHPGNTIKQQQRLLQQINTRLFQQARNSVKTRTDQLTRLVATLDAVSPLATLERGYAIVTDSHHRVITRAAQTRRGDRIRAQLHHGNLLCRIEDIDDQ